MRKGHVVEQNAAVGDVNVQRVLHRLGRQADLPSDDRTACGSFRRMDRILDGVGVGHCGKLSLRAIIPASVTAP
jgi:hypothetical protein